MATSTAVSVEEYLRTTYHPDMEYVGGQLLERHVGEYFHSMSQALITGELLARSRERRFRVFTEQRVRVNSEPRYRIPDVCVKALPHKPSRIMEQPNLVIEVVSPDDELSAMLEKIADYATAGIPYIWVFDPNKRSLMEVVNGVIHRPSTTVLATPLVGEIDFADILRQLDEPAE